ncbi:MAG TPA: LLM class flavin-dependent oxidoreductase [Gemmatimonadaceae bacterium]|nr:LLM class flavin-dependent oxidoreductase [Gemmatimonadaceae bacterium]
MRLLSVLDQSPVSEGSTGGDALRNSIDLARLAESLGYHRYWIAEHHATPMLASPSPEALIGPIAALTTTMRIGTGGVMLPHYSPLKVAETFSMLAGLFPGRIDLGIGRASGTDPLTTFALQRDRRQGALDDFPEQLQELRGYLEESLPADHPFARVAKLPGKPETPEIWLLGSSPQSAIWAGELGLPYVFADFINSEGAHIAALYRERFAPSARLQKPRVMVATWALCADTREEAERLATSSRMALSLLRTTGKTIPVPTVETATRFLEEPAGSLPIARRRRMTIGTKKTVRDGLEAIARDYGAEEVMIVTITHSHEARKRSYQLVAEAFELQPPN